MKTMPLVLFAGSLLILCGCDQLIDEPPDFQVMREMRPLGTAKGLAVNLKFDIGTLEIQKGLDENLFSFDLEYDRKHTTPKFDFKEGDSSSLNLEVDTSNSWRGGRGRRRDNELTLRLSEKVPLELDVESGVSESHLDLTGLAVRNMRLRGGVGKTDVTFDKPVAERLNSVDIESGVGELIMRGLGNARVERLDLKGGVGRTELDFTGDLGTTRTDCTINVGVGQVRLVLPRDADIEIEAGGSFLSNINAPSFDRNGNTYTHQGTNGSKIHIRVESGLGGVTVELI